MQTYILNMLPCLNRRCRIYMHSFRFSVIKVLTVGQIIIANTNTERKLHAPEKVERTVISVRSAKYFPRDQSR